MELYISETIRKYRKQLDLTQEQLAADLGVSPQSVSKWECNDGYPDITFLPNIANYFKISIDELLGNDKLTKVREIQQNDENFWEFKSPADRVETTLKLFRKYPHECDVASQLAWAITLDRENLSKNLPLLKETCEFLLDNSTDYWARDQAIKCMCSCCSDEEADKWLGMSAPKYNSISYEILEARLWELGRHDESREMFCYNNLHILLHFLGRERRHYGKPEMAVAWYSQSLKIVESLSENGEIPKAWLGFYADTVFRLACAEFGLGKKEDGYKHLEDAFELYPKWLEIPKGTILDLGNSIFGGMKIEVQGDWNVSLPGGKKYPVGYSYFFHLRSDEMYTAMTYEHGWEWFNSVREEPKFKEYVARAKELAEKYQ